MSHARKVHGFCPDTLCANPMKVLMHICGASSRYPYKVGDHMNSPRSKKNTREAEFQAFHHFFGGGGGKVIGKLYNRFEA